MAAIWGLRLIAYRYDWEEMYTKYKHATVFSCYACPSHANLTDTISPWKRELEPVREVVDLWKEQEGWKYQGWLLSTPASVRDALGMSDLSYWGPAVSWVLLTSNNEQLRGQEGMGHGGQWDSNAIEKRTIGTEGKEAKCFRTVWDGWLQWWGEANVKITLKWLDFYGGVRKQEERLNPGYSV